MSPAPGPAGLMGLAFDELAGGWRVLQTLARLLPALLGIAAGYVLRRRGIADQRDGDFLFILVVNIFLPALSFTSLSRVQINRQLAIFPLAAVIAISVGYLVSRFVAGRTSFEATQQTVLICCRRRVTGQRDRAAGSGGDLRPDRRLRRGDRHPDGGRGRHRLTAPPESLTVRQ